MPNEKPVVCGTSFYVDFDKVDCTWKSEKNENLEFWMIPKHLKIGLSGNKFRGRLIWL